MLKKKKKDITLLLYIILIVLLATSCIALYFRYRYQKAQNDLLNVHTRLNMLTQSLAVRQSSETEADKTDNSDIHLIEKIEDDETKAFKRYMEDYLLTLDQLSKKVYMVPLSILESDAYTRLQERITHNEAIKSDDPLWEQLHDAIRKASPDFDKKLNLLSRGQLNTEEFHTILLIKAGIKPAIQRRLFCRELSTITNRRTSIGIKLIGKKCVPSIVDTLIQNL